MGGDEMTKEADRLVAVKVKRESEEAKERSVKAAEEAKRATEAEAVAKKEVEEANERVKKAAAEVKSAMEAEATAKSEAGQAKDRVGKAIEEASKAVEVEARANRGAEQASRRLEAEEAKIAKKAAGEAKKEAEQAAKERAKREAEEAKVRVKKEAEEAKGKANRETEEAKRAQVGEQARTELYSGMVTLLIARPIDYERVGKFEELLAQVKDLRVMLVGGSADEGNMIVVSVQQSVPLLGILSELPLVEGVSKKDRGIEITLKAAQ